MGQIFCREQAMKKTCTDFNVILLISYSFIITIFTFIIPLFSTFGFVFLWGMQYAHANFKFLDCFTSAFIILTHSYSHHLQLAKWNTFIVSVENELLSLVLICHRSTCDIAAGKAWFSYAADVHATWPPVLHGILFRYENRSVAGSTGSYVAGNSAAYENQA